MKIESTRSHPTKIRTRYLHLPQEIIEEILPKLPVKSLLRFRCVSKSWLSFMSKEQFTKTHHQNSIKNQSFPQQRVIIHYNHRMLLQCPLQSLLHEPSIFDISPLDVPTSAQHELLRVVGCYNGLICILQSPNTFFLWNPSTRISKRLPNIDKTSCVIQYGFGWVELSDEYKVFALLRDSMGKRVVLIYSSRTKTWKVLRILKIVYFYSEVGVFSNGKLHWYHKNHIVTFDLKNEVFEKNNNTRLWPFDRVKGICLQNGLGVVGDCLCVLSYYGKAGIRVWIMKEHGWERVGTLTRVLELLERPISAPFTLGKNGEIVLVCGSSTFLIYYPRDNVFRCPKICGRYGSHRLYVESLVSPELLA